MTVFRRLFLDMDGVLADFDAGYAARFGAKPADLQGDVDWKRITAVGDFYATLPPMPDTADLWAFAAPFDPTILTGIPPGVPDVYAQKAAWAARILGPGIQVIGCRSADKADWCCPGDVLVDDREQYMHKWIARGGAWVTHRSARDTIARLRMLGFA